MLSFHLEISSRFFLLETTLKSQTLIFYTVIVKIGFLGAGESKILSQQVLIMKLIKSVMLLGQYPLFFHEVTLTLDKPCESLKFFHITN